MAIPIARLVLLFLVDGVRDQLLEAEAAKVFCVVYFCKIKERYNGSLSMLSLMTVESGLRNNIKGELR
jgi:hypothetical protein